jgi:hypothetical protein
MQYAYLYFDLIMKRNISTILKYKFALMRVEPALMRVKSSQIRVEPTRSMVRLQCHAPRRVLIWHACACIYCYKEF